MISPAVLAQVCTALNDVSTLLCQTDGFFFMPAIYWPGKILNLIHTLTMTPFWGSSLRDKRGSWCEFVTFAPHVHFYVDVIVCSTNITLVSSICRNSHWNHNGRVLHSCVLGQPCDLNWLVRVFCLCVFQTLRSALHCTLERFITDGRCKRHC